MRTQVSTDLLIYQTGDFGAAVQSFAGGGEETYHEQKRSVDFVIDLGKTMSVCVVSRSSSHYDLGVAPGVRAIGLEPRTFDGHGIGRDLVAELGPKRALVRLPHLGLIAAASKAGVPTMPCLADVFDPVPIAALATRRGLRRKVDQWTISRCFRRPSVTAVCNHSLNATRSLIDTLGVPEERCVPWEWPQVAVRAEPKDLPQDRPVNILYVGSLSQAKGIGDLIEAVALLRARGKSVQLTAIGAGGEREPLGQRATQPDLQGSVTFSGRLPKADVRRSMQTADIICVPTRLEYAEGLPNALVEGLASRTPLVVTDHPAMRGRVIDGKTALLAHPSSADSLAERLTELMEDPVLYRTLSENAGGAYASLFVGKTWYEVVSAFVDDPVNETGWVAEYSLARRSAAPSEVADTAGVAALH